ncbi:DUF397 domain-containing protein [Streptomyces roseolus]|uniref:DUF397 domain-containing protein n=1 Tax=Streptomyces roseolus TaxID=67358 RepID=UPI0036E92C8B
MAALVSLAALAVVVRSRAGRRVPARPPPRGRGARRRPRRRTGGGRRSAGRRGRREPRGGGPGRDSCVEVVAAPGAVRVRDSKDLGLPQLVLSREAWAGFVGFARHGG